MSPNRSTGRLQGASFPSETWVRTSFHGYGLPISEVISEGNVGLMQAVKRFEPEKRASASPPMPCGGSKSNEGNPTRHWMILRLIPVPTTHSRDRARFGPLA
jgi:hypothetical protein